MVLHAWCGVPLAALFSVLVLALMTGGFHLDGLADTCDGVFSARSRDRMLEIMRDSRLGTHGGLALIFVVLAKILVLSELALRANRSLHRWRQHVRSAADCRIIDVSSSLCPGRRAWQCVHWQNRNGYSRVTLGLAAIFAAVLLPGMHGVAAMVVTMVAIFILGQLLKRTLGGQTGDTLGAAIELGELVFLLALL